MGLTYFEMELVYFLIPKMEPLFPYRIAAYLKWIQIWQRTIPHLKWNYIISALRAAM